MTTKTGSDTMPLVSDIIRKGKSVHSPHRPRRITMLGAVRITDPEKWERMIRKAMADNDGVVSDAAADLDVSMRQLFRWLRDPRFEDVERAPKGRPTK